MALNYQDVIRDVHDPVNHALQISGTIQAAGQATVSLLGTPTVMVGTPTLYAVVNTSAAGVGNSIVTINPRVDYIGLMSVSGNVNISNPTLYAVVNTSAAGVGNSIVTVANPDFGINAGVNSIGFATVNQVNQPALVASSAFIGLVTVANTVSTTFAGNITIDSGNVSLKGNVTLSDSKGFIGLTSIQGNVNLNAGINNIGFATVAVSTPTIYAVVNTTASSGLATVDIRNTINANVSLSNSLSQIGFATVYISTPTLYAVVNTGAVGVQNSIVTLASSIPAGINGIGFATVNVAALTLGTYAVDDSAMPATPQTLPVSAEYRLAATTYADGDVTVLQSDENGNLKVTLANQLAGEDLTDNLIKVGGNIVHDSADAGNPVKVGGKAASSEPSAVTAGDRVNAYFDTTGHQHVKVDAIAAGVNNIGDVDVASVVPGTGATNLGKAEDAAHTTGDVGVMMMGVRNDAAASLSGTDGDYTPIKVSSMGHVKVVHENDNGDDLGYLGATGGGIAIQGDVSHDFADANAPAKIGGKAHSSTPTAVAANDRVNAYFDLRGRQQITPAIPEQDLATEATTHVKKYYTNSGAVTDGIVWSSAAGKRWYVTDIFINVSAAATVTLEDDLTAGDAVIWKAELAANSGWSHHFGTPLFSGEDAADLLVTTTAGNIYITVTGYEI